MLTQKSSLNPSSSQNKKDIHYLLELHFIFDRWLQYSLDYCILYIENFIHIPKSRKYYIHFKFSYTVILASFWSFSFLLTHYRHGIWLKCINTLVLFFVPAAEKTGLSGGQVAGVTIGVLGLVMILCVLIYILRSWTFKKPKFTFEEPSLGFDNALFHKNQDTVSIN